LKIIVLTKIHEIECPHCGKKIFLVISEGETREKTQKTEASKLPETPLPEVKIETPMEAKEVLYEWVASLPIGSTFTIDDVKKVLRTCGYEGSMRGFGVMLYSLTRKGCLEVVDLKKLPDGREHNVYRVVRKLRVT